MAKLRLDYMYRKEFAQILAKQIVRSDYSEPLWTGWAFDAPRM